MLLFCFFFFKQKTAYEITRRDWSSDVCSSDLDLPFELDQGRLVAADYLDSALSRSEERRVGKECALLCRTRWLPDHLKKKKDFETLRKNVQVREKGLGQA